MAARACSAASAPRPTATARRADLAGLDPRLAARRPRGRLRRLEPAPRSARGGRRLRSAEGRLARPTSRTWTGGSPPSPTRSRRPPAGARSATPRAPAPPAVSASRCWRSGRPVPRRFALRPGVDLVMDATDFDARLAGADLVITGEGRIDAQTAFGKTALGVARRAAGRRRAVHRGRWRRRTRGDRGACRGRRGRGARRRATADGRGGDGGRHRRRSNAAGSASRGCCPSPPEGTGPSRTGRPASTSGLLELLRRIGAPDHPVSPGMTKGTNRSLPPSDDLPQPSGPSPTDRSRTVRRRQRAARKDQIVSIQGSRRSSSSLGIADAARRSSSSPSWCRSSCCWSRG